MFRFATVSAFTLVMTLLGGCGESATSSSQATGPNAVSPEGSSDAADDPERLVLIFQKQKEPDKIREAADQVAGFLSEALGMPVDTQVPSDYDATVQSLISRKADVAYVSSIPFLLARRDGGAKLLLAEVRPDAQGQNRTDYDSVIVVREDSPLQSMADVKAEAKNLTFCFTSSTSTSGYIMAILRLVNEGILKPGDDPSLAFRRVDYGGGYVDALRQVLGGRADLCAVSYYTVEGPTAENYLPAADRAKLRILARTPGVPTHLVAVRGGLGDELTRRIKGALLKLSHDRPDLLRDVYGAKQLVEVDEDQHVRGAVEALGYIGKPIEGFVK